MKKILQICIAFAAIFLFSVGAVFAQGSTTGSMSGLVTDGTGPLPGATIIALHVPTGAEYATISNILGNYIIKNMKVGTGYQVTVSYIGFKDAIITDIAINLGQNFDLDFTLSEAATELAEGLLQPNCQEMDRNPPELAGDQVKVHPSVRAMMKEFGMGGWIGATVPEGMGGEQLPHLVADNCYFIFAAANYSACAYAVLSAGVIHLLESFGSKELIDIYDNRF